FKEEIAALSRIDHPGVVRALDVGDMPDGRAYFVMQYVPGVSLRSVLSSGGLDFDQVAHLVRQMGQALTAAHRQGVVHRDLKPENIMLQPSDEGEYVKLIDFGIATVIDDANASGVTTTTIIGTREYMAPEQLMGKPTAASDIYALGIVAYEMLTGHRPFNEVNVTELYEAQRDMNFTRPRYLRHDLPPAAEDAILKALQFDPEKRFAQAKDFTETLACALTGETQYNPQRIQPLVHSNVVAESPRRTELWLAIAGMLVIVLGASAAIWWQMQPATSRQIEKGSQSSSSVLSPERELSYSLTVRKDPSRYPKNNPFILPGEIIFEAGYQVQLNISSPQSGYLYVINEGPNRKGGLPEMNLLFPEAQQTPIEIHAIQSIQIPPPSNNPELDWFVFDKDEGVENVWIIWAARPVAELEAIKHVANSQDQGEIKSPDEIKAVTDFLRQHSSNKAKAERDEDNRLTRLKARGDMLVGLVRLEHH
ncbi:MAG TPA: protein kinase, partial [Blastocatellia bacterium]|nr:protein kinase [Blastocatellia bacterium]